MKKLLLLLSLILTIKVQAQTNPDQNFDGTWITNAGYAAKEPLGWVSTNALTNMLSSTSNPTSVTQSTLNCSGGFSMRVETYTYVVGALAGMVPDTCGFVFTGTVGITMAGGKLYDGFAYNQRPTQITYCCKANPMALDTSGVGVLLWKWNGSSRSYIGGGKNTYTGTMASMVNQTLNIAYSSTVTPDSMSIYVGSSYKYSTSGTTIRKGAKVGSVIYVDNFVYPATTTGVKESTISEIELKAYPNPANTSLYVTTENSDAKTIEIIDLTGKTLEAIAFNDGKLKLDVSKYNSGLYFYRVSGTNKQNLKTGKFTVTH